MDNGSSGSQEEEHMWKKALLSRDFDLCHTRLLMLDGQVAPEERLHLVGQLFSTIKEIEGIILKEPIKNKAKSTLERLPSVGMSARDVAAACIKSGNNSSPEPKPPATDANDLSMDITNPIAKCPICCTRKRKTSRHYCDSCRVYTNRLIKMNEDGVPLPACDHQGKEILYGCRGCRRYRYQLYWPQHKSEPFPLPLL